MQGVHPRMHACEVAMPACCCSGFAPCLLWVSSRVGMHVQCHGPALQQLRQNTAYPAAPSVDCAWCSMPVLERMREGWLRISAHVGRGGRCHTCACLRGLSRTAIAPSERDMARCAGSKGFGTISQDFGALWLGQAPGVCTCTRLLSHRQHRVRVQAPWGPGGLQACISSAVREGFCLGRLIMSPSV